jgi:hypothetical protein
MASVFQRRRTVDEKHGVVDVVFLAEFVEESRSKSVVSGRFDLCMQYSLVSGSTAAYSQ